MKCLILAAGYATRLYPLTKDTPKPLLEVAGMTILERLLDKISVMSKIDTFMWSQFRICPGFSRLGVNTVQLP